MFITVKYIKDGVISYYAISSIRKVLDYGNIITLYFESDVFDFRDDKFDLVDLRKQLVTLICKWA